MKKVFLILIVLGAAAWYFRYPLAGNLMSPFIVSSKEKALIDQFDDICFKTQANSQNIMNLVQQHNWQALSHIPSQTMTAGGRYLGGWMTSDEFHLYITEEKFSYGPSNVCMLGMANARSGYVVSALISKFSLGVPDSDASLNSTQSMLVWNHQNMKLSLMKDSNPQPEFGGNPSVSVILVVPAN